MNSVLISTLIGLSFLFVFVQGMRILHLVNTLKFSGVNSIVVDFVLHDTSIVYKSFTIQKRKFVAADINTMLYRSFVAMNSVTFSESATVTFKAATSLRLLQTSPDLVSNLAISIYDDNSNSGTSITQANEAFSFSTDLKAYENDLITYMSLQVSQIPSSPLKISWFGAELPFTYQH